MSEWFQKEVLLRSRARGVHLIGNEVLGQLPEIKRFRVGMAQFFLMHTSASLSINENADPDVRTDLESHLNQMVPENAPYYRHTLEGSDDMPAHIKSSLLGASVLIPIADGKLKLGTWQGLYLCEHRNAGGGRRMTVTLWGETAS